MGCDHVDCRVRLALALFFSDSTLSSAIDHCTLPIWSQNTPWITHHYVVDVVAFTP